jgi:hypothetical protein
MLPALALVALFVGSAIAAPKSSKPGKRHPGIRLGVSKPKGGTTVVTADGALLSALTTAGVAITPSGAATMSGSSFTFPITGGRIVYKRANHGKRTKLLAGFILHAGSGLTLTKATTTATISNFRIVLAAGKIGRVDVKVGKGKLKLATLSNVAVNATSKSASATLSLTPAAAAALNAAFGTTLPKSGAVLGTVVITPTF